MAEVKENDDGAQKQPECRCEELKKELGDVKKTLAGVESTVNQLKRDNDAEFRGFIKSVKLFRWPVAIVSMCYVLLVLAPQYFSHSKELAIIDKYSKCDMSISDRLLKIESTLGDMKPQTCCYTYMEAKNINATKQPSVKTTTKKHESILDGNRSKCGVSQ